MNFKELAEDPLTQLTAGLSGIIALLNPEILWALTDALIASGPQLFSVISLSAVFQRPPSAGTKRYRSRWS